ncbi:MAG: glycosyltransferase family 9 protein [Opitutaceae bacterium]
MRRLLILRGGALGDFLVTLPALALLRQRWPDAEIELIGNPAAAALAQARGLLNRVHAQSSARWLPLYGPAPLPPDLEAWLRGFDLILSFQPDPSGELAARFPLRPGQRFLAGAPHPAAGPAAAHFCAPLRPLGLVPEALVSPLVPLVPPDPGPRPVLIHPGSGSPRKNWPVERWLELAGHLPGPVTLLLGEAEIARPLPEPLATACRSRAELMGRGDRELGLLWEPPLEELLRRLAGARAFLGHDSGVSHLAACAGTPSLLLFGPTDPAIWKPPVANVQALRPAGGLEALTVPEALASIRGLPEGLSA